MKNRKLRVAFISRTSFGVMGGAATYQFASKVNENHDVRVFSPRDPANREPVVFSNPDVRVTNIYSANRKQQINNLYDGLREFQPDIVHMMQNSVCLDYCYYARHAAPTSKWIIDFRSPHVGESDSPALRRYWFTQFYVDRILTHSMESLTTNIKWRFRKTLEVPPGIELSSIPKREHEPNRERLTPHKWVFIGSISETRKIDQLCDGFLRHAKKNPGSTSLDIFGAGNALDSVRQYVMKGGGQSTIRLLGTKNQHELFNLLPSYDAGIAYVPNAYFSTAPSLKSLEYAAARLPFIASDTIGHRVYRDKHGFQYELFNNDAESICSALDSASREGFPIKNLELNYERVRKFDWRLLVDTILLPAYEELTND